MTDEEFDRHYEWVCEGFKEAQALLRNYEELRDDWWATKHSNGFMWALNAAMTDMMENGGLEASANPSAYFKDKMEPDHCNAIVTAAIMVLAEAEYRRKYAAASMQ